MIESTGTMGEPVPVAQKFCHSLTKELEDIMRGYDVGHDHHVGEDSEKRGMLRKRPLLRKRNATRSLFRLLNALTTRTFGHDLVTVVDSAAMWDVLQCSDSLKQAKWSKEVARQAEAVSWSRLLKTWIAVLLTS
ncbi:unnamed protein product [Amoebophrya sp. A25]|nr:unnamed protein product [Amoebophrya sp. A25]|eukprot:GSA25T00020741001.1